MNTAARYVSLYVMILIFPCADRLITSPQLFDGPVVCRLCRVVRVDEQHIPSAAVETCSCSCPDECLLPARKHCWIVSMFYQISRHRLTLRIVRYVWPKQLWGPTYINSYAICIASSGTAIIMCLVFRMHLRTLNRKLDQEEESRGVTERGFRYIL